MGCGLLSLGRFEVRKILRLALLTIATFATTYASAARAGSVADFYRGKRISLIIGSGEGGGYDLAARLIGRYLGKYIPGHPNIVPRNMPGASSVVAADYIYNVAPKDGTVLGVLQPTIISQKLLGKPAKYEPEKFSWIGRLEPSNLIGLVWHTSPVQTIDEAKQKVATMAANGASGTAATVPWALNRLVGTKFKVILGYHGSAVEGLALERGEADGIASTSWEYLETQSSWLKNKKVRLLYAVDTSRIKFLPKVPALPELADNAKDRQVLWLLCSTSAVGRSLISTPQVPAERIDALSRAFAQMVKSPDFIAAAKKQGIGIDPLSEQDLRKLVAKTMSQPSDIVAKLKAVTEPIK